MKIGFGRGVHRPNDCLHGPQDWPRWRLMGWQVVKLGVVPPSTGWRFWAYFRSAAFYFDVYFDRRE